MASANRTSPCSIQWRSHPGTHWNTATCDDTTRHKAHCLMVELTKRSLIVWWWNLRREVSCFSETSCYLDVCLLLTCRNNSKVLKWPLKMQAVENLSSQENLLSDPLSHVRSSSTGRRKATAPTDVLRFTGGKNLGSVLFIYFFHCSCDSLANKSGLGTGRPFVRVSSRCPNGILYNIYRISLMTDSLSSSTAY